MDIAWVWGYLMIMGFMYFMWAILAWVTIASDEMGTDTAKKFMALAVGILVWPIGLFVGFYMLITYVRAAAEGENEHS